MAGASRDIRPVEVGEVAAVLREARDLAAYRPRATRAEVLAYHERKADLLERIAAQAPLLVDVANAEVAAAQARAQVDALRATCRDLDRSPGEEAA